MSFPFNINFSVISLKEKVRIWCSFYWPAIFKMIWTNLGTFSQLECFFFFFWAKWSKEALFFSLVNVFTSFWIFGEKKRVSKINPILKYAVLWHSSLNIDGCYYSPNCEYGIFPILKNCKYLWSKKHKDHYPLYWNVKEYAKNTWACQKCDPWTSNNPFQEIFTQIFWPYQEKDPFNTF